MASPKNHARLVAGMVFAVFLTEPPVPHDLYDLLRLSVPQKTW